ncbi:Peptidase_M10 domain-containing protein/PG_binding_1 domain-containing protein, partial [Cephalotus follicularis]
VNTKQANKEPPLLTTKYCNKMALKLANLFVVVLLILAAKPFNVHSRTSKSPATSFTYFQNLEGSYKGQTPKGLQEVKHYLKAFGYYPHGSDLITDDFDDLLDTALKTYQKNYNLKVSGILDADTIKQMKKPRCGVPDIINGKTKNGKKTSDPPPFVALYTFFNGMPKWPSTKKNFTYSFSSSVQVVDMSVLRDVASNAFQKWADVSGFTFAEAPNGAPSDMVIGFQRGDHGDGSPFDGPGRTVAHAFAPTDGRFHYDADENWSTDPMYDELDLESVAVHEIGHLLGLGHSTDPNAVMYAEIEAGTIKRDLDQDDIDGIHSLYP